MLTAERWFSGAAWNHSFLVAWFPEQQAIAVGRSWSVRICSFMVTRRR